MDFTVRDHTLYVRLPDGGLMPYSERLALLREHRDCCPECPVRKRLEGR